jgi:hypothetical protein
MNKYNQDMIEETKENIKFLDYSIAKFSALGYDAPHLQKELAIQKADLAWLEKNK